MKNLMNSTMSMNPSGIQKEVVQLLRKKSRKQFKGYQDEEDDFVDDIDSWSDMEMEIMLEADEYNDMVYWENVIREESL